MAEGLPEETVGMSWFRRKKEKDMSPVAPSDLETVKAKIATCDAEIAQAEANLRTVSLQAALSEDPNAGSEAIDRLNQLRGKRELLTNALQAAEQAQAEREAQARHREWQARRRALSQQTGRLQRDAVKVTKALATLEEAIGRMEQAGSAIVALCPPIMKTPARPFHELFSPLVMRDLVRLERYRLGDKSSRPERLGNYMQFQDPRTGMVRSMTDILSEKIATVKALFERAGPTAPVSNETSPPPVTLQQVSSVGGEGGSGSLPPSLPDAPTTASEGECELSSLQASGVQADIEQAIAEGLLPPAGIQANAPSDDASSPRSVQTNEVIDE